MQDNHFGNIARKPLSPEKKEEKWRAISAVIEKEKQKNRLSYYSVLIAFSCLLFFFLQTLQAPKPIEEQTAAVSELGTITEAIFLRNEKPSKRLNLASPFYIGRVVITEKDLLKKLEQLFAQTTLAPIERDLSTYEYSHDLLLRFANGESRYIKITAGPLNSPSVVVDMDLKQRYISDIHDFSLEVENVQYDNTDLTYYIRLLIAFPIVAITYFFVQKRRKRLEATVVKNKMVGILGAVLAMILLLIIVSGDNIFGADHLGRIALFFTAYQILPAYIFEKWGNVKADWLGISLLLAAMFIGIAIMLI
ncbi:hypothetical protein [Metasolibacillus sp.]|uniref:hypothetical protein n=1 Tax=Metasolibacillus sp. TaxID=2703680 RepID=UPI0025F0CE5C|nr:hypothetical protein [Metasolibacillus sp.]MCT6924799.1 hypothetical protein [Metasolibacillus sp.]MCT6941067.1 hypothetical protein [Metasolibacillus sp.]